MAAVAMTAITTAWANIRIEAPVQALRGRILSALENVTFRPTSHDEGQVTSPELASDDRSSQNASAKGSILDQHDFDGYVERLVRKRLLIHTGGFNLGLLMRHLIGVGTPRGLQGRLLTALNVLIRIIRAIRLPVTPHSVFWRLFSMPGRISIAEYDSAQIGAFKMAFTTDS